MSWKKINNHTVNSGRKSMDKLKFQKWLKDRNKRKDGQREMSVQRNKEDGLSSYGRWLKEKQDKKKANQLKQKKHNKQKKKKISPQIRDEKRVRQKLKRLKNLRRREKKRDKLIHKQSQLSQKKKINYLVDDRKVDYYEYINSDKWRERRKLYYKDNQRKCICCDATVNLDLHHITYFSLGNELDTDLAPMCKKCHKEFHRTHRHNDKLGLLRFARNIRLSRD